MQQSTAPVLGSQYSVLTQYLCLQKILFEQSKWSRTWKKKYFSSWTSGSLPNQSSIRFFETLENVRQINPTSVKIDIDILKILAMYKRQDFMEAQSKKSFLDIQRDLVQASHQAKPVLFREMLSVLPFTQHGQKTKELLKLRFRLILHLALAVKLLGLQNRTQSYVSYVEEENSQYFCLKQFIEWRKSSIDSTKERQLVESAKLILKYVVRPKVAKVKVWYLLQYMIVYRPQLDLNSMAQYDQLCKMCSEQLSLYTGQKKYLLNPCLDIIIDGLTNSLPGSNFLGMMISQLPEFVINIMGDRLNYQRRETLMSQEKVQRFIHNLFYLGVTNKLLIFITVLIRGLDKAKRTTKQFAKNIKFLAYSALSSKPYCAKAVQLLEALYKMRIKGIFGSQQKQMSLANSYMCQQCKSSKQKLEVAILQNLNQYQEDCILFVNLKEKGLVYIGNSCYINSVLTALKTFKEITSFNSDFKNTDPLIGKIQEVFKVHKGTWNYQDNRILMIQLKSLLPATFSQSIEQQDVNQLFVALLQHYEAQIKDKSSLQFFKKSFYVELEIKMVCPQNHKKILKEEQSSVILYLPDGKQNSIQKLMRETSVKSFRQTHCQGCSKTVQFSTQINYLQFPQHLILVVNRFIFDKQTLTMKKNLARIRIEQRPVFGNHHYSLKGLILHSGQTLDCGHYVYYQNKGEDWKLFNDTQIMRVEILNKKDKLQDVLQIWQTPYIIFYDRQKL